VHESTRSGRRRQHIGSPTNRATEDTEITEQNETELMAATLGFSFLCVRCALCGQTHLRALRARRRRATKKAASVPPTSPCLTCPRRHRNARAHLRGPTSAIPGQPILLQHKYRKTRNIALAKPTPGPASAATPDERSPPHGCSDNNPMPVLDTAHAAYGGLTSLRMSPPRRPPVVERRFSGTATHRLSDWRACQSDVARSAASAAAMTVRRAWPRPIHRGGYRRVRRPESGDRTRR